MKIALILQAWYEKPDKNWYPWLKQELEKRGYKVYLPDLPTIHTKLPDLEKILQFIKALNCIDKNMLVFGHSIGCLIGLRLAEKYRFNKLFLIAGWDSNDLYKPHRLFWKTPINHRKIKNRVKKIYCFTSDNDPFMTAFTVEQMSIRLNAKYILIKGAGHFTQKYGVKQIPQLLEYI